MLALPAPIAPIALPAWRKPVVLALWSVAAAGIAMAMPSAMLDVGREAYRLLAAQPVSLSGIAGAVVAMITLTSAGAAYSLYGTKSLTLRAAILVPEDVTADRLEAVPRRSRGKCY